MKTLRHKDLKQQIQFLNTCPSAIALTELGPTIWSNNQINLALTAIDDAIKMLEKHRELILKYK